MAIDISVPEYRQAAEESYISFNDNDIESAILNLIIIDNNLFPNISDKISEFDFAFEMNRQLYSAIKKLYRDKIQIDIISLNEIMKSTENYNPVYIAGLTDFLSSSANWEFYVRQMLDISALRKTDILKRTVLENLNSSNIRERLESASKEFLEISIDSSSFKIKKPDEIIPEMLREYEEAYNSPPGLSGYDWGLEELNNITDGIQNEFIVIGARPSKGKTALGLKIVSSLCDKEIPVGLFTLETTEKRILNRCIATKSHIPSRNLKSGAFSNNQGNKIFNAAETINNWQLFILDDIYYIEDIKSRIRYMVRTLNVKVIVIDYFGRIRARKRYNQLHEMFKDISNQLAELRKELGVPIILLAQVRRDSENKNPGLDSLGETRELEHDADTVIFINQDRGSVKKISIAELIIAKQRDGPCGTIQVGYIPQYTEFVNLEKERPAEEKQQGSFYDSMVEKEKTK